MNKYEKIKDDKMLVETINIKQDMPPSDVAVAQVEIEIERLSSSETKVLKIIHGYGSHGVGGEIKKLLHQKLNQLLKYKKIKDYVPGEKWSERIIKEKGIVVDFPQLILDSDLKNYNNGITIIFLN